MATRDRKAENPVDSGPVEVRDILIEWGMVQFAKAVLKATP
jgi:hypothetical protein